MAFSNSPLSGERHIFGQAFFPWPEPLATVTRRVPSTPRTTRNGIGLFILRPEGPSLALRSQPAVSDDAFRTHRSRAQFHATHAHHADIAHTQNSHRSSSRPPACSHSETNRPGANFHRPRIPRPPLLIQPHFADRVSGVVSHRANPRPYSLTRKAVRSRYPCGFPAQVDFAMVRLTVAKHNAKS